MARVFFFLLVSCLLEMLVNCTYDIKTNILFLVFNRCYEYHTTFSYNGNQDFTYLKHHHVNCGLNKMIQSIKLERNGPSGDKIRYNYTCCETPCQCNHHVEINPFTEDEDGKIDALYRQNTQCSHDDFITSFNLTHNTSLKKICYRYRCCSISGRNKISYRAQTPSNEKGNGKVIYLDRHGISCKNGYGLTKFHLIENDDNHYQYNFSCTKILPTCDEQGKSGL